MTRAAPLALTLCCMVSACQPPADRIRMATTTSVENSGLLAAILPEFERQHGIRVEVLPVGSGQALNLLSRGDVEAGLTHNPEAEAAALAARSIASYRKIMFNDFIIVGPPGDPAGVAHAPAAVEALQRIAAAGALFASRGDESGTHARERELWALASAAPAVSKLLETGQGMAATLRVASERGAYTLADRATFEQFRSELRLGLLCEGGPELLNTYAIFLRSGLAGRTLTAATSLADWFAEGEGRKLVAGFRANGRAVFTVWPSGAPRDRPADVPDVQ